MTKMLRHRFVLSLACLASQPTLTGCGTSDADDPALSGMMGVEAGQVANQPTHLDAHNASTTPVGLAGGMNANDQMPEQVDVTAGRMVTATPMMDETPTPMAPSQSEVADDLDPTNYCETTVDMLCSFYLRCGRIAADSSEDCRQVFLETCNERFEPIYVSLVRRGFLKLSNAGLQACQTHLSNVGCDQQIFDLDGRCSGMWLGTGDQGSVCSVGIESFTCKPGLSCEISTNLCGECRTIAEPNQPCANNSECAGPFTCVSGGCTLRGRPGDACGDLTPCDVGSRCEAGVCRTFTRAKVGEPCDQVRRCPYRSVCSGGVCVKTSALGQPCTPQVGCMSGYCDEVCKPLKPIGAQCETLMECRHNRCTDGVCGPEVSACLTP